MKKILLVFLFLFLLIPTSRINAYAPPVMMVNEKLKICRPSIGVSENKDWKDYVYDDDILFRPERTFKSDCEKIGYKYIDRYFRSSSAMYVFIYGWFLFILEILLILSFLYLIYRMIRYRKVQGEIKRNMKFFLINVVLFIIVLFLYAIPQITVG